MVGLGSVTRQKNCIVAEILASPDEIPRLRPWISNVQCQWIPRCYTSYILTSPFIGTLIIDRIILNKEVDYKSYTDVCLTLFFFKMQHQLSQKHTPNTLTRMRYRNNPVTDKYWGSFGTLFIYMYIVIIVLCFYTPASLKGMYI